MKKEDASEMIALAAKRNEYKQKNSDNMVLFVYLISDVVSCFERQHACASTDLVRLLTFQT
jgi:hypothetical protein